MWYRWLIYPVLFILSAFLLTVFPNADVFAQCLTGDRAEGLISTPVSINKFGNPASLCIIDPRATFATYEIPTYTDFISTYYQLPKALPENLQHGFRYVNSYTPAGGSADESYFNGGTGRITGNSVYHINGNLTLYSNLTIPAKSTIIIFVEQDLLINSNIDYDDNSGGIIFIVRGNININYLVSRVNAVLISAGAHNGAVQTDYSICTGFDGTCPQLFRRGTSALTINGTMASICSDSDHCTDQDLKPIKFRRSINDNSNPAETINFQAKYLILLKDAISQSKKIQTEITDYDGVTSFPPSNIAVSGNNSICQDLCTDSNLITGRIRDGAGFCGSGTSHTCPSTAYNNQSLDCGGLSYTCNSTWGSTGSSSGTSSSINCTSTPVCSDICTAPANSCTTNGGTKTCNYTTYLGSTNCIAAAAPSLTCTATCSATNICVNGSCTTTPPALVASAQSNTFNWDQSCGTGDRRMLIVVVSDWRADADLPVNKITYASIELSKLGQAYHNATGALVAMYYLVNPAANLNAINVDSTHTELTFGSSCWSGVNQTAPTNFTTATGTSFTPSITIPIVAASNQIVVDGVSYLCFQGLSPANGQSLLAKTSTCNSQVGHSSKLAGNASEAVMSWNISGNENRWAMVGATLAP